VPSAGAVPAAASSPPASAAPAPALQIPGGVATMGINVHRQGDTLTANVKKIIVHNLVVQRGNEIFSWPRDFSAQLLAQLQTQPDAGQGGSIMSQLARVTVSVLNLDTGVSTITLNKNGSMVLQSLSDPAQAGVTGGIVIDGDLEPLERLTEVTAGMPANTYPYKGHYHFEESLQKDAGQGLVKTIGGGDFTNFQIIAPPPPPAPGTKGQTSAPPSNVAFTESDIAIRNSCNVDINSYSFSIDPANPISVTLKSSGAMALSVTGGVTDLLHQRQINDIGIQMDYDLAKLWPIVKPLLPPSQQQTLADLVITGKAQRTFKISGSLPTDKPFNQAVVSLTAGGYFTIDTLSTHGIDIAHLDLPVLVKDGVARTVYPDQPEGANAPQQASCNQGTIDLGIMALDLRTDPMTLTMPNVSPQQPHFLFKNIALTKAVSKSLMVGILSNPLFVDADKSEGDVDVRIDQIQNLPLSALVNQQSPDNKGVAEVHYSVRKLVVGSPLLTVINGGQQVTADINDADVKVAGGKLTEDTTMMISGNALRIWGTVILSNQTFAPMTVSIPTALLPSYMIPGNVRKFMPDTVVVPMKGDMSHPKIELDKVVGELVKQAATKALINGATGGNGSPLNGLLKGLGHH
jgi:hypothetical protein